MVVACRFMGKLMVIRGSEYILAERLPEKERTFVMDGVGRRQNNMAETAVASSDLETQESSLLNSSRAPGKLFPNLVEETLAIWNRELLRRGSYQNPTLVGRTCDQKISWVCFCLHDKTGAPTLIHHIPPHMSYGLNS